MGDYSVYTCSDLRKHVVTLGDYTWLRDYIWAVTRQ